MQQVVQPHQQHQQPQLSHLLQIRQLGGAPSQLLKDPIRLNKMMGIKPHTLSVTLGEEYDYVEHYEQKILPERKVRASETEQRRERWNANQTRIFEQQAEQRRVELHMRDIEYSRRLEENERVQLERELKMKQDQDSREHKILQVSTQFPFVEMETIKAMLEKRGWDLDGVIQQLKVQFENEKREEEKKENMVLQLISTFPSIEFEQAQTLLQRRNWNLEAAMNEHRNAYLISLNLHTINIPGLPEVIPASFQKSDEGFQIISMLTQRRDPTAQGKYYKLFRNRQCTVPLSYLDLSQNFIALQLFNNDTIYVIEDAEPPF